MAKLYGMLHPEASDTLTDSHSVATHANWKDGEDVVIVPSIQDPAVLAEKFPKGFYGREAVPAPHAAARPLTSSPVRPTPRVRAG